MERAGVWALNGSLFVLGCIFLASTVTSVIEAVAIPAPPDLPPLATVSAQEKPSWQDRQQIGARNIFQAVPTTTVAPKPEQDLGKTNLPLELLGTVVANNPEESIAAIKNVETRKDIIVRQGELVYGQAVVKSIERRRVVILNNGKLEELSLDKDGNPSALKTTSARYKANTPAAAARRTRRSARRGTRRPPISQSLQNSQNLRSPQEPQGPLSRRGPLSPLGYQGPEIPDDSLTDKLAAVQRDPMSLLKDADVRPKYDERGQMMGMEVGNISAGSLFEDFGVRDGDIIVGFNGVPTNNASYIPPLMKELSDVAPGTPMKVLRDGVETQLEYRGNK